MHIYENYVIYLIIHTHIYVNSLMSKLQAPRNTDNASFILVKEKTTGFIL